MADHRPQEGNPRLHTNANTARNNGVSRIPAIASAIHDHQPPQRPHYSLMNVNFGKLLIIRLVGLVSSYRESKEIVDLNVAKSEAAKLHELINGKHLDHDNLMFILSTRNFFQLRATFDCYKQEYGEGIAQDISNSGNGDLEALLKVVILCIAYPEKHFAEDIRASIEGLGTNGDSLTIAIVRRAEVDMVKIKEEYLKMYGSSIDSAIASDTSGDSKEFLLTSIGAKF
ncbi:hypothetical protein Ancab_000617 [Ancistrocladus abbreviatus]